MKKYKKNLLMNVYIIYVDYSAATAFDNAANDGRFVSCSTSSMSDNTDNYYVRIFLEYFHCV